MLTFDFDQRAFDAQIDAIKAKAEAAIRPAAQAGAQVYYEAVIAAAPKSKEGHWFQGSSAKKAKTPEDKRARSYWYESGSLKDSIYQVYSKDQSSKTCAEYQVAWNHHLAPYGFMVAYGTKRGAKANDFIGKARKSVSAMATEAMLLKFNQAML